MRIRLKKKKIVPILYILPALVVYLLYFVVPIPMSLYYSFFQWNGLSSSMKFVGLENWISAFHDNVMWISFVNNWLVALISIATQIPIGLGLGILVSMKIKGMGFFRAIFFVPLVISTVAVGITWSLIYEPTMGFINVMLHKVGLGFLAQAWLGDPRFALLSVMGAIDWQWIPFYIVVFAAAISDIPKELFEAAKIDGANAWQRFVSITLPSLKKVIITMMVFSVVGSMRAFDQIYVMTGGGPMNSTSVLAIYMYKEAFVAYRMGYASTIAMIMFITSVLASFAILKFTLTKEEKI